MTTKQNTSLKSLKCTQCGAPIQLYGGHNVKSIVCQYCGACLDAKDSFKVLHKFINQKRPFLPIKIGSKGKLRGVDFTVIGVVKYSQMSPGGAFTWLEYLMFSYTHGYAYLCYEDKHWVMTHEVKDIPETQGKFVMPRKSKLKTGDKTFKVFECSAAKITYVEGELTWKAVKDDEIKYLDAICPPYIYSIEHRIKEREFFLGEYIPHEEIDAAFNIKTSNPSTIFSCQPYKCSPIFESLALGGFAAAIIAILAYFIISSSGSPVMRHTFTSNLYKDMEISQQFTIDRPNTLYSMKVMAPALSNSWSFFDLKLINKEETEQILSTPAEVSYYYGYEDGERWTEGSKHAISYFKSPETGDYKIAIEGEGGHGERPETNFSLSSVDLSIYKGIRLGHYTLTWFFICLLAPAIYGAQRFDFEKKRWGDEDDDEDDD